MKKRIARIVVYFCLGTFLVLVLAHPYVWQSIFGPKIKGEPLWAWQQQFRAEYGSARGDATLWEKTLNWLRVDRRATGWTGSQFPRREPEMVPVLVGLAVDADVNVRKNVISIFCEVQATDEMIAVLIRMLDDAAVRDDALVALRHHRARSRAALPRLRELLNDPDLAMQLAAAAAIVAIGDAPAALARLRELLNDPDARTQLAAATSIIAIGDASPEVRAVVLSGLKSASPRIRLHAIEVLTEVFKDDDEIFRILTEQTRNDPKFVGRSERVGKLSIFGAKAVPCLLGLLATVPPGETVAVVWALGKIGVGAKDAIPALASYAEDPDPILRAAVAQALHQIDPQRCAKK